MKRLVFHYDGFHRSPWSQIGKETMVYRESWATMVGATIPMFIRNHQKFQTEEKRQVKKKANINKQKEEEISGSSKHEKKKKLPEN